MSSNAPATGTRFKRILVPTDGSRSATAALRAATEMAVLMHAELAVLTVMEPAEIASLHAPEPREFARAEHLQGDYAEAEEIMAEGVLADAKTIVNEYPGVKASFLFLKGDPATEILRCAEEIGADAIVMGRRGFGRLKSLIFGSVSQQVASHARHAAVILPREQ